MARQLVRGLCFAALAITLALQGCGKSSPGSLDRPVHAVAARAGAVDPSAPLPIVTHRGAITSERYPAAGASLERYATEDSAPWLAELLHAPNANVRVQGLDAWARQPTASLDPVTYALVDPDESVRMRAQEVLEQELARR
jgi:hypothetical protein